jgi:hypothetical protein
VTRTRTSGVKLKALLAYVLAGTRVVTLVKNNSCPCQLRSRGAISSVAPLSTPTPDHDN